jgi:hypothetical protein
MKKFSFVCTAQAVGLAISLSLFGPSAAAGAAELTPFRVGEAAPANTFLAIWMAEVAGFYQAEGLQLEIVHMVGGSESGPALKAGRVHLMHLGMSSVVRANTSGRGDLRCIGSLSNVIRSTLFAAPQVKTAADLKGGVIGISSAGSESDSTTTLALRRFGLTRADVIVREIGVDRLPALRAGQVAATVLGEPQRSEAFAARRQPQPRRLHRYEPDRRVAGRRLHRRDGEEIPAKMRSGGNANSPRWLAEDPVLIEPVCERKFPDNRENPQNGLLPTDSPLQFAM